MPIISNACVNVEQKQLSYVVVGMQNETTQENS